MDEAEKVALPQMLRLGEDGQWYTPTWARTSDDDQWIWTGYRACDHSGNVFFRHKERAEIVQWLVRQGYQNTGDDAHYRLKKEEADA